MTQHFGLGLRSQLMLALMLAFGAAFVLLSLVTARLDERDNAEERAERAALLTSVLERVQVDVDSEAMLESLVAGKKLRGVELVDEQGGTRRWGRLAGPADATRRLTGGETLRVWLPTSSFSDARRRTLFLSYLGLTAVAVLLLSYLLMTYFIVRPVDSVRHASERLALGRLNTRVPVKGAAEVARLASAFNEMAAQLRADRSALQERLEELEATTAELEAAQNQVIRSARLAAVGQLSAGVAHEIGNPLTAIRGLAELLQTSELEEGERQEFVARLQNEAERIHRTIRDLLDFSRHDPEDEELGAGSADLADVITDTVRLLDRQQRFVDIDIELAMAPGLPAVRGNHERLRQLVLNLLFNAADALSGKGRIEIRTEVDASGNAVSLFVSDDGPGIDPKVFDELFDPFVTTKPAGKGTGLGLAVCDTIVERLGGSIQAQNLEQRGACFRVSLPLASAEHSRAATPELESSTAPGRVLD